MVTYLDFECILKVGPMRSGCVRSERELKEGSKDIGSSNCKEGAGVTQEGEDRKKWIWGEGQACFGQVQFERLSVC